MNPPPKGTVAPSRHETATVAGKLRRRIVRGRIKPGQRLPPCRTLAGQFGVSHTCVHRALRALARDGFVTGQSTRGLFVADLPPHLFRYGVVFQSDPAGGERGYWPPAWQALHAEALRVPQVDPRRRVVAYYNITGHTDVPDYQRLLHDLRAARLAGLMFANAMAGPLLESPIFHDPTVPRVVVFGHPVPHRAAAVTSDDWGGVERALDYLKTRGRKQIALIDLPDSPMLDETRLTKALHQRSMNTQPYWIQAVNHETAYTARKLAHLLMSGPTSRQPDGLVIINPFLVEHVTAGLVDAGIHVPQQLDVVAGGNFPHVTRSHVPTKWFGEDCREALRLAIESIDRARRSRTVPRNGALKCLFEEELPTTDPLQQLATHSAANQGT